MSERSPIKELPEYKFAESADLSAEDIRTVSAVLKQTKIEFAYQDNEKNPDRLAKIDRLIANQYQWLEDELGVSVRSRGVQIDKIKFYSNDQWNRAGIRNFDGFICVPSKEIKVREGRDEIETLFRLNHELVHAFSRATLDIKKGGKNELKPEIRLLGFHGMISKRTKLLNEAFTEMINLDMTDYYRRKTGRDDLLMDPPAPAYYPFVIFFDQVIERIAEVNDMAIGDVKRNLYRGYFEGDPSVLRIFDKTFGKGSLKRLTTVDGGEDDGYGSFIRCAETFHLDVKKLKSAFFHYDVGESIHLSSGVVIRKARLTFW